MNRLRRFLPAVTALRQSLDRTFLLVSFIFAALVLHRFYITDANDPYKCKALLKHGQWLDPPQGSSDRRPYQNWQTPGCMLHEYTANDISTCLQSKKIVLVGDSTIRQIYWAIAKKLDQEGAEQELVVAEKHGDLNFERSGIELKFIWDPFINGTELHAELAAFQRYQLTSEGSRSYEIASPGILLVGGGLWHARHINIAPLKYFRDSVDNIVPYMHPAITRQIPTALFGSIAQPPGQENLLLLAPVQVPLYEDLSPSRSVTVTPTKIDPMNDYLLQMSGHPGAEVIWSYSLMTWQQRRAYEESGLHVVENVANRKADVLLNLRCNAARTGSGQYPFDRTCCSNYNQPGWVQWAILPICLGVLPITVLATMRESKLFPMLPSYKTSRALLILGFAMCYCFYADRTHIFNKAQKQFFPRTFQSMSWMVLALGLLSLRRSSGSPTPKGGKPAHSVNQPFLSRDQTDEWKGWMQFMILIYHYAGASKVLWIYEVIRILVASYLFMTGFGHTIFFYTKGDYSLRRFASVLIRLNLLSCLLPYVMRTDYLFYYFAPLVTFWFVVIYFTMKIGRSKNDSFSFLISKILLSATIATALILVPGILEKIFLIFKYTCRINWNVVEWRFRVFLDMYIVYVGMFAGVLYVRITNELQREKPSNRFLGLIKNYFRAICIVLIVASLVIIPGFWTLSRRSPDKYDYNWWQPYISPLPIIAFMILRNSNHHLRNYYFSLFAWLGRCSLETFTLQFHIWLAADTKGLLSLGIFNRTEAGGQRLEFLILTALFLWISWHVAAATGTITIWMIDPREEGRKNSNSEDEDRVNGGGSTLELSRTKSHEWLPIMNGRGNPGRRSMLKSIDDLRMTVTDSLQIRLGLMLLVMWLLNMTYT